MQARLKLVIDTYDCCNIFISEGAGVESIVAEMEAAGEEVPRDAFGHIKLDKVNPGQCTHTPPLACPALVILVMKRKIKKDEKRKRNGR
eukprot:SAG11_NODE_884_length_6733_cov_3.462617_3_plen_89_part_00